ncbi:CMGC/CLK protein kinase [Nannizzia gypsea CBS 118893]|uniref:dual-specificity kinase n=1 Tax=Arthroderma gypseum (strain ATCC MYA-4604 / CBS 118893) TaxID=535722 RepID=E4V2I2_ARTGP|nr:CMGC/CLK protein kinase [Nannizzia gypsea CBS 118893]EFR04247.1 CMGC/CLK protein kinase [Nannizzia gypsea CBS 118893]
MSTPSTATATHPSHQRYGYSRHQVYHQPNPQPFPTASAASNALANSFSYTSSHQPTTNGISLASTPKTTAPLPPMASYSTPTVLPTAQSRRKQPDWGEFYKNGVPKEIIVIDDDDDEDDGTNNDPVAISSSAVASATSRTVPRVAPSTSSSNLPASKKRRTDASSGVDVYYDRPAYSVSSQKYGEGSSAPSMSTDRTASIHTTAPTSLGSQASASTTNNVYLDDVAVGQKRKRVVTRKAARDELKRRELETVGDAFSSYIPPPKPPIKAKDVVVPVIRDYNANKNQKIDDEDGHYIVNPDTNLTDKYSIIRLLGQGTFGKVVEAYDRQRKTRCAVKIIRSVQKYRDASRIELRVLSTLASNDETNRNRCIHLRDCFDFRNHICIVTDLLGQSVFDFLKANSFVPFPSSQIQNFARQLFTSVAFLHDVNLIHTDLKPENILLVSNAYQTFTYNRTIPSSSHTTSRTARQRRVLLDSEIRLIDFGSATFDDEYHSSVVSTRHYRAPEIILNLGWSFPCDIWSIGCILVEFFTGDALFQTHDNLEHLAMMESVCGGKIDPRLVRQVLQGRNGHSANSAAKYFNRTKLDYPNEDTSRASRKYVKAMKQLHEFIPATTSFNKQFLDLLRRIFVYDPKARITAKEALKHPWFKDTIIDDGTEAVRIRQEQQRGG